MASITSFPFARPESLEGDYVIATYLLTGCDYSDVLRRVGNFAVGQTIGTWVAVPGITAEMVERYQGRVLGVVAVPAGDGAEEFVLRVAFPSEHFGGSLTMLMTALVGNDVSTSLQVKLVDLELAGAGALLPEAKPLGLAFLREQLGVYGRPLVLNMIKPCAGYSPQAGAEFLRQVALGGIDLIKDDELLGSPSYNTVGERTRLYQQVLKETYEQTGKRTLYIPNVSGPPAQMRDNAARVLEAGAVCCMVNFSFAGLDALRELCAEFAGKLFILCHYAGFGAMQSPLGGIDDAVFLGVLPRLAGASAVMTMSPDRSKASAVYAFRKTVQAQRLQIPRLSRVATVVGGGITPLNQTLFQDELGPDCVIGIGGAVQGHPDGARAGAQAAMCAVESYARGISPQEAALACEPLARALSAWS